jgi:predicted dehydrogenase
VHAPGLAAHAGVEFIGVYARRQEAAEAIAADHGGRAFGSYDELLSTVDGVAFAVPPKVQAEMAITAAQQGKHVILEKPIAADVEQAQRLADAAAVTGIATIVMLTRRFAPETRDWLANARRTGGWQGGAGLWLAGGLLGGPYSNSPWRHSDGAIADLGPHLFDLADKSLGEITGIVAASRTEDGLCQLMIQHGPNVTSTAALSLRTPGPAEVSYRIFGTNGVSELVGRDTPAQESYATLLDEFTELAATGRTEHPCGVRRGLHLQRVLAMAFAALEKS